MAIKELKMTITDSDANQKEFNFVATESDMKSVTASVASELSNYVAIPGFRKGKAPAAIVVKRYEGDVKNEVLRKLMAVAFDQIEADKTLDILNCSLADHPENMNLNSEFSFSLKALLAPEIALPDYKSVKIDLPETVVTDAEVDERIAYFRNMYGNYADVTGSAAADDMLKVSYSSDFVLAADAPAGLTRTVQSDDNYLWLNDPEFIPGSTAALTGAEIGKEYNFTANFPADWRDEELAGKSVNYTVKVHAIQRRTPINNEELCLKMQAENIDMLKDMVRTNIIRESEMKRHGEMTDKIYNELDSKITEFELPAEILAGEIDKELRQMINQQVKSEEDVEKFKESLEGSRAQAETLAKIKLRKNLILRKVAKVEDIDVTSDEVDNQIAIMSRYYGYKTDEFRKMLEQNGSIEDLRGDILSNKVLDKLASYAEKK